MTRSLARWLALGLALGAAVPAWADKGDDDVKIEDDDQPARSKKAKKASGDQDAGSSGSELQKQDLSGHDLGTSKKDNQFEHDRFFVDKVDSDRTSKGTLVQGSLTSTTFGYFESGGTLAAPAGAMLPAGAAVPAGSEFSREYTDLRLQTDFRHIAASRWDARIDVRGRLVNRPDANTPADQNLTVIPVTNVQSGFLGQNELEIKEAWLVRNGIRSDVFLGRQFIPDLGGVKIDGLRIDYASSSKFTLLGFGGLYPIRGSRSITTDYQPLKSNPGTDGKQVDAGRFTGAGGFGAAYRTPDAYGSFGGVALVPLSSETPRIFGTSTGYWRYGSKLDFYHFAVLDLIGSNAVNAGLTNLSAGLNYKPDQRLRGTLSYNRVDTETLNVQAQAFLTNPDPAFNAVQNEAYLQRIATNEGRGSLSAGLGELQRFEITAAVTYRYRGEVTLSPPPQTPPPAMLTTVTLPAAQSVEVYGAITDRRSIKDLRLGVDGSRVFGVGSATYQRTASTSLRASASRELAEGRGEWEAEVAYSSTKDDSAGTVCGAGAALTSCFGAANSTILSLGGNLYYRFNRDWFAIGSLFLNRTAITHVDMMGSTVDPAVIGLSGFLRLAYRF
ncbi:MAG TPA: hypothetical protein VHW23_20745 [Kofleriaceae bacterium]|jgi:hypothetical protein|nr:hypothetical protein [Kofleriaceae bacterium]